MLPGFEEQTKKLSSYEKDVLLPLFIRGLSKKFGKENSISAEKMASDLFKYMDKTKAEGTVVQKIAGARVRKILNHIRMTGAIEGLVGTSRGYYITNDPEELKKWIESLKGRIAAEEALIKKAEIYLMKILNR